MRSRRGFSLVELAITVAIFGILAMLGMGLLKDSMSSWRVRRAAMDFSAALNLARMRAMSEGVMYRVSITTADIALGSYGSNAGTYLIQRGSLGLYRTGITWDTLPVDLGSSDSRTGDGLIQIGTGGSRYLKDISISPWSSSFVGLDGDSTTMDIVFNPHGWVENPVDDFNLGASDARIRGYIQVLFVNKAARRRSDVDDWNVFVSRGGAVRLVPTRNVWTPSTASGASTSSTSGTGGGYH